jgi:hypothetical protein
MFNSEELIGTTEHVTLYKRCPLIPCRYNRFRFTFEVGSPPFPTADCRNLECVASF